MSNNIEEAGIRLLEEVRSDLPNVMKSVTGEATRAGILAGQSVIRDWFGQFHGERWINSVDASVGYNGSTLGAEISIDVWATDEVGSFATAERWRRWYGGEPSNIWVSNLIFNEGIVGLPQYANTYARNHNGAKYNGPGWSGGENMFYHQFTPLRSTFESGNQYWDSAVDRILDMIVNAL